MYAEATCFAQLGLPQSLAVEHSLELSMLAPVAPWRVLVDGKTPRCGETIVEGVEEEDALDAAEALFGDEPDLTAGPGVAMRRPEITVEPVLQK